MTVKITYTSVRPSKDIAFYGEEFWSLPEIILYMKTTYEDTGKLLGTSFEDSEDTLTHIWIEYWDSQESIDEFATDTFLNQGMASRAEYRKTNGIEMSSVNEFVESAPVGVFYRPENTVE